MRNIARSPGTAASSTLSGDVTTTVAGSPRPRQHRIQPTRKGGGGRWSVHPGVRTCRASAAGRMKSEAFTTAPGTPQPGPPPTMPSLGVPRASEKHGVPCFQLPVLPVKSVLLRSVFGFIPRARTLVTSSYLHSKPWAPQELESSDASRHALAQANRTQEPSTNETQTASQHKGGRSGPGNLPFSSGPRRKTELRWPCGRRTCPLTRPGATGTRGLLWAPEEPQICRT